jgi:cell division protein FtsB
MSEALDKALVKIQHARAGIRDEIDSITGEITRLEQENRDLPNQTASFGEIKKAILELVEATGARYADTHIRASIIDFAKGAGRDMSQLDRYGKTLTLGELNGAIRGEVFPMANTCFLSGGAGRLDDLMLYAVLSDAVKETLSRMMDLLSPADLGLPDTPSEPAMTRAEMTERIVANRDEVATLKARKEILEGELVKLS